MLVHILDDESFLSTGLHKFSRSEFNYLHTALKSELGPGKLMEAGAQEG